MKTHFSPDKLIRKLGNRHSFAVIASTAGAWMVMASIGYCYGVTDLGMNSLQKSYGIDNGPTFDPMATTQPCVGAPCVYQYALSETFWYPGEYCDISCGGGLFNTNCYDLLQTYCYLYVCKNGYYYVKDPNNTLIGCTTDTGNSYTHPCPNGTCIP